MTRQARQAFEALLEADQAVALDESVKAQVQDDLGRFRIWAENIGAQHGPRDQRSLEHRLRQTPEVIEGIRELLQELRETLEEVQDVAQNPRSAAVVPEGDEESLDDPAPQATRTELEELCLIAGDVVTSLLRLSTLMRKATVRDRYARAAAAGKDYPFDPAFDIRHVRDLYPKLAARPWLATRLGTAIMIRRQFLRYSLEHRDRLAAEASDMGQADELGVAPSHMLEQSSQYQPSVVANPSGLTVAYPATVAQTTATTVQADAAAGIDMHNLSLSNEDDAVSGTTSFASTASQNADQIRVVRLDSLSKNGSPFECPYYRGIVQFKHQTAWKRHVFHDLRAYVCTFEDCTAGLFQSRTAWFDHEMSTHRRMWVCLSCEDVAFDASDGLNKHFKKLHAEDLLETDEQAVNAMVAVSSRPMERIPAESCPLCDEWAGQLVSHVQDPNIQSPLQSKLMTTVQQFRRHLAGHLEQLALSAIPMSFDPSNVSREDSDVSSEDGDLHMDHTQCKDYPSDDRELLEYIQRRVLDFFIEKYDFKPGPEVKIEFEGGCPGPWTEAFARRVQRKWKPLGIEFNDKKLQEELEAVTEGQYHSIDFGIIPLTHVYWISKESLLLDGPAWRVLEQLQGWAKVQSIIRGLARDVLFSDGTPLGLERAIRKSRLFFWPFEHGLSSHY